MIELCCHGLAYGLELRFKDISHKSYLFHPHPIPIYLSILGWKDVIVVSVIQVFISLINISLVWRLSTILTYQRPQNNDLQQQTLIC